MNEFILLIHCFHDDEVFELRIGSSVKSLPVEWGLIKADWRHWLKKNDEIHVSIIFVVVGRTFQDVCLTSFVLSPSIHFFFLLPHQVAPLPLVHFSQGPDREFRRFFLPRRHRRKILKRLFASRRAVRRRWRAKIIFLPRRSKNKMAAAKISAPTFFGAAEKSAAVSVPVNLSVVFT